jgi:hypothetical protein
VATAETGVMVAASFAAEFICVIYSKAFEKKK